MKVITIKQPWASLIVHGIKDIENRTWACPKKYIGQRVLIHASTKPDNEPYRIFNDEQANAIDGCVMDVVGFYKQTGCIIGSVEIIGCTINHHSIWAEKTNYYKKPVYNWVLAKPALYENLITAKGKLSFWDYPGIKEVKIECPECGSIEIAVEDYTTDPFPTFLHSCNKCGYVIMESEWNIIKEGGAK